MRAPSFHALVLLCVGCGSSSTPEASLSSSGTNPPGPVTSDGATPAPTGDADSGGAEPNAGPSLDAPADRSVDEETETVVTMPAVGIERFEVEGLPPGARFDHRTGTLTFTPDFTQSGRYPIRVTGYAKSPTRFEKTVQFALDVRDSIAPPAPVVVSSTPRSGYHELLVRQVTDAFLDSPARSGRTFDARVAVPDALTEPGSAPVQLWFHGFGGSPAVNAVSYFMIAPHDPENTYWYGYGDAGTSPSSGRIQPYTMRRAMHLLDWVMRSYPATDANRVFTGGDSMGGAGAMTVGMLYARHFAGILSTISQTVPRLHHSARLTQLSTHWGTPQANVDGIWDRLDLTRLLRESPEARDQFVSSKHGKDDRVILFRAVVTKSPLTGASFYETLESQQIGHLSMWDEGGHGTPDPVLGHGWYDAGWSRMFDPKSRLRRDLPFPAFTHSSANDDPGDDQGNGRVSWTELGGFAGNESVGGDTGWGGTVAGAINRFLRWDIAGIEATRDRLRMPLYVVTSPGDAAPRAGYPTKRDLYTGPLPIRVDVTPRRTHAFAPLPGEQVRWRFGSASGTVVARADGSVTVQSLPLLPDPQLLELERDPP